MYDSSLKYRWDNKNVLDYALKEGQHKKAIEIARELKKEGLSIDFIAKTTGLSIEEIEKL
jgi:predicted transposase/invertase (TIGR01784 family)